MTEDRLMVASGWGPWKGLTTKGHKGTFRNDKYVLNHDYASGFIDVHNCQNSLNCTIKNEWIYHM